jgi:hypothetical protein
MGIWWTSAETNNGIWFQGISADYATNIFLFYNLKNRTFSIFDYNFNDKKNLFYRPRHYSFLFDNDGLYESYEFRDIVVNKPFDKEEFLKTYKDYNFK